MSVVIETSIGDFTIDLLIKERPKCCFNFLKLCKLKYYNLCFFHRIEKDFIAQSGDPSGTGKGGHSVYYLLDPDASKFFPGEIVPKIKHTRLGTVSMVNNGDDMHGSQFFITLREDLDNLDNVHTVFGYIVESEQSLQKMNELFYSDIIITHTVVLDDPFDDPPAIAAASCPSPEPSEEILERISIALNIDDHQEIDAKTQESKAAATILEMVGDLPSEDALPPDNVLFVCKLNSVTKEEDLKIIFGRFGPIISCEIIKDHKTGDSLQYGFIEFERTEDCENAYFKMDNVIIDEKRIHVDFSQSVSKIKHGANFKDFTSKYHQYKRSKNPKAFQSDDASKRNKSYNKASEKGDHQYKDSNRRDRSGNDHHREYKQEHYRDNQRGEKRFNHDRDRRSNHHFSRYEDRERDRRSPHRSHEHRERDRRSPHRSHGRDDRHDRRRRKDEDDERHGSDKRRR